MSAASMEAVLAKVRLPRRYVADAAEGARMRPQLTKSLTIRRDGLLVRGVQNKSLDTVRGAIAGGAAYPADGALLHIAVARKLPEIRDALLAMSPPADFAALNAATRLSGADDCTSLAKVLAYGRDGRLAFDNGSLLSGAACAPSSLALPLFLHHGFDPAEAQPLFSLACKGHEIPDATERLDLLIAAGGHRAVPAALRQITESLDYEREIADATHTLERAYQRWQARQVAGVVSLPAHRDAMQAQHDDGLSL